MKGTDWGRMALVQGSLLVGMMLSGGCPPAADVKGNTPAFVAEALPDEPAALLKIADSQLELGAPRNALVALERAQKKSDWAASKEGYEAQWRLARAYADLSEPDGEQRTTTTPPGLAAARRAIELDANRVEGHYYLGQLLGYSALTQKGETKATIQQMAAEAESAMKLDEKFDHAGPLRMLGVLYSRAPKEPVSVGDPEKGVQFMKRAVAADGDYPMNHIYLAEAYIADERYPEAESELAAGRKLLASDRWGHQLDGWKAQLSRVERKLKAKQS